MKAVPRDKVELYKLGMRLRREGNRAEAEKCFRKSAEGYQGYAPAQYELGMMLKEDGNYAEARKWLEKAADQGYAPAQYELGMMLRREGNRAEVRKWLEKAAEQGHARAQYALGLNRDGWGVPQNKDTALLWLEKAAREYETAWRAADEKRREAEKRDGLEGNEPEGR